MFSSTARLTVWRLAGVVTAVGAFVAASAGMGSAATFGSPYQIGLDPNTKTPITAASFPTTGSCDGVVPAYLDGWHFVVPGGATLIVSFDLAFNPPSPSASSSPSPSPSPSPSNSSSSSPYNVIYTMDRQGAFVVTLPGAQLVSAAAIVVTLSGQPQAQFLELANTCPASAAFSFPTFTPAPSGETFSPNSSSLLPTGQDTPIPASVPLVGTGAAPGGGSGFSLAVANLHAVGHTHDYGVSDPHDYGDGHPHDYGDGHPHDYGDGHPHDYGDGHPHDYGVSDPHAFGVSDIGLRGGSDTEPGDRKPVGDGLRCSAVTAGSS